MTAMLPAHLSETLNNLGDAARELTNEVRADSERRVVEQQAAVKAARRYNRRMATLLAVVALLVAGLVLLSVSNRRLGVANSQLNRQNAQIIEQIRSCTTAGGACYEQSQRRTGDAVQNIIRAQIYARLCLRDHPDGDDTQIEACVKERLASRPGPAPTPS